MIKEVKFSSLGDVARFFVDACRQLTALFVKILAQSNSPNKCAPCKRWTTPRLAAPTRHRGRQLLCSLPICKNLDLCIPI